MKIEKTERGFKIAEFTDRNGTVCTIQESSLATESAIWLGAKELEVQEFVAHRTPAWRKMEFPFSMEHHFVGNERMHLTQDQVRELLPVLQKFADTGEIE